MSPRAQGHDVHHGAGALHDDARQMYLNGFDQRDGARRIAARTASTAHQGMRVVLVLQTMSTVSLMMSPD